MSPSLLWLVAGILFCSAELVLPTAFTAFIMGVSAIIVGLFAIYFPQMLAVQIILWMGFSLAGVLLVRRFLPKRKSSILAGPKYAETLTEILPGQAGRILYDGNSWRAVCEDEKLLIEAGTRVYVVRREGTTLFVIPEHYLLEKE